MFGLLHIFTIISYYFYSTAYISLKRNYIKKGKEQNTWCNRNQSFLQCSCVENGERRNYPQCNMISPTMHTRSHSVYVCVCVWTLSNIECVWGGILNFRRGGILNFRIGVFCRICQILIWGGILNFRIGVFCRICQISIWGGILNFRIGVFCRIWTKISTTPAGSCITDSLSHTTYVETNE